MKRILLVIFAALGGLALFAALFFVAMSWALLTPASLPDRFVLEVDLGERLVEGTSDDPVVLALERRTLRTRDVVEALHAAADDPKVAALVVRNGSLPGWATAEELREAVAHFRAAGKPAIYFADSFGELSPGQLSYHLATAFDEIHLQPSGEVALASLELEVPFLRGALDRLEVEPRFERRWEYKDASEILTETGFTPDARVSLERLVGSLQEELIAGMTEGRGLSVDSAWALIEAGPHLAREALEVGLVDALGYLDEARDRAREWGEVEERVGLTTYRDRVDGAWSSGSRVALVYGVGSVHRGRSGYDPLTGGSSMGGASVSAALREAIEDDQVRAILFRVDSPGGSWVASDQIARELRRAREAGKPVVVSMSDVAASGGYAVSMDADRIVAHPSTFTGSIGVFAGRLVTEEFFESFGVTWDRIEGGESGGFYSGVRDFSPAEWERFQGWVDRVYDDFVDAVARGRGMERAEVEAVARGRVWTGKDALDRGLVDRLGGFGTALEEVRELLDLAPDAPVQLALYPAERTLFQVLLEEGWSVRFSGAGIGARTAEAWSAAARPLLGLAAEMGLIGTPGPVRMAPFGVPGR